MAYATIVAAAAPRQVTEIEHSGLNFLIDIIFRVVVRVTDKGVIFGAGGLL